MSEQLNVSQLIADLPCAIRLPAKWHDYFDRNGPLPSSFDEFRQYPRFYSRSPAALRNCGSLPALHRSTQQHRVYVKDISRFSVAFIHSEQLYPREKLRLTFINGKVCDAEMLLCRRHQEGCFEAVAKFLDDL